jgi:hypothetical protein
MPQQPGAGNPARGRKALRLRALRQQIRANRLENLAMALKARSDQVSKRASKARGRALQLRKKAATPKHNK